MEGRKASVNCVIQSANKHGLEANTLLAVWEQEAGPPGKIIIHPNGAVDIGEMQINRRTIKSDYAKYGITEHHLKSDGCYAADLAARRISDAIATSSRKKGYWKSVANYHNKNEPYNSIYAKKIQIRAAKWDSLLTNYFSSKKIPITFTPR